MKKITLLFIAIFAFGFSSYAQCNYSIELRDSFSDGYQDTTMDVFVNGGIVLEDITIPEQAAGPGGDKLTFTFSVSDGDIVTVVTTVGPGEDFPEEISYVVYDALQGFAGLGAYDGVSGIVEDTLAITAACPACDVPEATFELISNCPVDSGFTMNVTVTNIGTASGIIITDDQGTAASTVLGVGTHSYGSYAQGTATVITVTNADTAICLINSDSYTSLSACPPANDDCGTSLLLIPSETGSEVWSPATTLGSTASGEVDAAGLFCADEESFGAGRAVWFKVEVPASQEIEIVTRAVSGSTLEDTVVSVFSGPCGALTEIACNDDNAVDLFSEVSLDNATDGIVAEEILYIRVHVYDNKANDDIEDGAFEITTRAADPALSLELVDSQTALSYFPNPVNDKLTLRAQQNIQNISVFNMLGQEVMRRTNINAQTRELDLSALQSGAYFVQVSINNTVETLKILKK